MPKRLKKTPSRDPNQAAHALIARLTADDEPSPDETPLPKPPKGLSAYMKALGQRGGKISGARRMTNLSDAQREAIALKAARARWDKAKRAKNR
jgi:hypothetical protein